MIETEKVVHLALTPEEFENRISLIADYILSQYQSGGWISTERVHLKRSIFDANYNLHCIKLKFKKQDSKHPKAMTTEEVKQDEIQLKVYPGTLKNYEVSVKDWDLGYPFGDGDTIEEAIDDFIQWWECKFDETPKYRWI